MTFDPRFPVGEFDSNFEASVDARRSRIETIIQLPAHLAEAVDGLDDSQLDTPYRTGGWSIRQVVHHVADSHSNTLTRFKLALTEDSPTIRPYNERLWAELADSNLPVDVSLKMVDAIHTRWAALLHAMSDVDFKRTFVHPETGEWTLEGALALYAWHSLHHTAHITSLRERERW